MEVISSFAIFFFIRNKLIDVWNYKRWGELAPKELQKTLDKRVDSIVMEKWRAFTPSNDQKD